MSEEKKEKKNVVRPIVITVVLIVAGYYGYQKVNFSLTHETTDNAQIETQITPVLPRVNGYVKSIAVKDYDSVKAGQLLVELDDAELQTQLVELIADYKQSEADLANAEAALNNTVVSLNVNKGNIDISEIKQAKAKTDYERDLALYKEEAITKKQLEDSKYNYETSIQQKQNSKTDYTSAESRVAVFKTAIEKTKASLEYKKAKIEETKLKLTYSKIYAPQSGRIGKRNITEGQFVQVGTPLFSIVNDTTYWIIANFKENQLQHLLPGKEVDIDIDAYPDLKLKGNVVTLSEATGAKFSILPPDNSSGNFVKVTQRVPVKISIQNADKYKNLLRAGLSVFVSAANK